MSHKQFANIPEELRALNQWCLWKYEDTGAKKPTKVPYSVDGKLCSVSNSSTWSSFADCFNVFQLGAYDGIGFVFSNHDPYTFIDLDDAEADELIIQRQLKIYREFDSYSEVSPSGKGLHIIVKGDVPAGRRRSRIEVYSSLRYATMTGQVYGNKYTINNRQALLDQLWAQMGDGEKAKTIYDGNAKELYSDEQIKEMASKAVNGEKFIQLYSGKWEDSYPSQSEADFALIDMLSFYTQNRLQINRLFVASRLGQRPKAKRKDYISGMINRSFDRMLPPIDFDGMQNALNEKLAKLNEGKLDKEKLNGYATVAQLAEHSICNREVIGSTPIGSTAGSDNGSSVDIDDGKSSRRHVGSIPTPATNQFPPGLLGEIANFIYEAAPRPVFETALAGAIALMAGITGRAYNVSGTGLNQYVLLLAATGTGKEAAGDGIDKLMSSIKMQVPTSANFIGPGELPSGSGLAKHLAHKSQSFLSIVGEFGLKLKVMSAVNANGAEISLKRLILDLYNKSGFGRSLPASAYSKKEDNNASIPSPAFSILGESTQERFYENLNEEMISEGLLPRFLIIEYNGQRPALKPNHTAVQPGFRLVEKFASLVAHCETINHSNPARVINVDATKTAADALYSFDKFADDKINNSNKEVFRHLWNRAHIKALKLSSLIAVGNNMIDPVITFDDAKWAIDLITNDIDIISKKFESGEVGSNTTEIKQTNEIVRVVKEYAIKDFSYVVKYQANASLHNAKIITHTYLSTRLLKVAVFRNDKFGATAALKRAIQLLVDNGRLVAVSPKELSDRFRTTQKSYHIDASILDHLE